jgi:hypothetical protein
MSALPAQREGRDEQMPGAGDPPSERDHAEPAGDAPQPAQRVGQDRNDSPIRRAADSPADLRQRLNQFRDGHPSSPNHEDGSPREPAPDLSKLESASEAHEDEPSPSGQAARRPDRVERTEGKTARADGQPEQAANRADAAEDQTGRAEHADSQTARTDTQAEHAGDGNSEGWRAALPQLQSLWERHAERWPADQRSPVDRSTDEPGSWRGETGHYLNFEENLATGHALDRVCKAEPGVTRTMESVETEIPGARLVGLENCLKGEDRFKEKVAGNLALKPERAVGKETDAIPDALRYTCQFSAETYVDSCRAATRELQGHGYQLVLRRNSWDSLDYKGINTRWRTTEDQVFEVQFHTPESFEAKQLTHAAYERLRNPLTDKREMGELRQFQRQVSEQIPVPDMVNDIRDFSEKDG